MAKLTYWKATSTYDCDDIRAKTKKQCVLMVSEQHNARHYLAPVKVEVVYESAFDLLNKAKNRSFL